MTALAVTNAPTVAIGYTQQVPSYSWYQDLAETTPELQWPQSVEVFDAMRRTDSQCASVLRAVTLPVRRTPWRIDPNGARAEVVELVANDLGLPIVGSNPKPPPRTRDRFSWPEHLRLALQMLPMGHCVDQETEALTQRGWLRQGDLRVGDMLLTLNIETGLSEWQPCQQVHRHEGTHTVRRLDGRSHSSVTTLNHRWITRAHDSKKLRFRTSETMNTNDRILRAVPSSDLPTETKWSDAFVELVAWYWTEGHEVRDGGAAIWQSEDVNGLYCQRIRAALTTLFGPARQSLLHGHGPAMHGWREETRIGGVSRRRVTYWYLDKSAAGELRSIAPKKVVRPEFIASLTAAQLRLFVDTSIDADGSRTAGTYRNCWGITQKDGARLDAFEMACSLLGIPWTRTPMIRGEVTRMGKQSEIRPVYAARRRDGRMTDTIGLVHDGVWCPQVENRTWLARRRGTVYFTGNSFFEQTYRIDPDGRRAHLRKLSWRPPRTIEQITVARDGGLVSITQYSTLDNSGPQKPIPVKQLVAYVHEREGGNWLGSSILRSAYKNWLLKDRLLRVQAQTIERNGMGIPLYTAQEGASPDDMAKGLAMATAWRAGEAAGSAVPFGANLVLRGVEGDLPDADPVVRYHDEAIARAVLAHFLNLGTQTGSWALGTTFADFFTLSLQTLAQQIADVATQHIIEDLVDLNWGESEPAPKLTFDEIGSRKSASASDIRGLIESGALTLDAELEEALRQWYGLPPKSSGTLGSYEQPPVTDEQLAEAIDTYAGTTPPAEQVPEEVAASYNPSQARHLKGEHLGKIPIGGRWRKLLGGARGVLDIARALDAWVAGEGPDQPLDGFTVPALRRAAKIMDLDHRGGRDELVGRIKDDVRRKVVGQRKAKADLADYSYGSGFDRPKARDTEGKLRDVTISQGQAGLRVSLLDERGNRIGTAVTVANWAQLRTWARREKLKDLAGWVDKYHPTTRTTRGRRDKRLGELLATLRRYDTYEEAELLLHGLEPAELTDLYTHLGGNLAVLPTGPTGRVSTRVMVGAILADWPTLRSVAELDDTAVDPMAHPARGSTPEGFDAVDDSGVYGSPADWGEAGFDVGYLEAAAGHDITPGHDELHHWWVYGKGRARWTTWTELYTQLIEHVSPARAKRFASKWFYERYGYWSGSDLNRVRHGKPPRGQLVGPG